MTLAGGHEGGLRQPRCFFFFFFLCPLLEREKKFCVGHETASVFALSTAPGEISQRERGSDSLVCPPLSVLLPSPPHREREPYQSASRGWSDDSFRLRRVRCRAALLMQKGTKEKALGPGHGDAEEPVGWRRRPAGRAGARPGGGAARRGRGGAAARGRAARGG